MPPFASEQFHAITRANPECIWDALTATGVPLDYLHGMTAESDWQPGAKVTMALTGQWRRTGQVLAAERPCRLSYTLDDPLAHHLSTSPGSYAPRARGRSSASTSTSPGRLRAAPRTSKAPGCPSSPALLTTSNEARPRPQSRPGETGRSAAAILGPAPWNTPVTNRRS
jgi:uncharacterized protein YndB with AHSA1/START domain